METGGGSVGRQDVHAYGGWSGESDQSELLETLISELVYNQLGATVLKATATCMVLVRTQRGMCTVLVTAVMHFDSQMSSQLHMNSLSRPS